MRTVKHTFITLLWGLLLTACNQNDKTANYTQRKDTTYLTQQGQHPKRLSFNAISEITAESSSSIWVNKIDSSFSLALHFEEKDTVWVSYSPECLFVFPYKHNTNKLVVNWDNNIDTKYDFDIVKAVKKIHKKLTGRPFMVLELENDTTLKATYLMPDLIRQINSTSKKRTFFTDKFYLVQEGGMYD